MPLSEDSPWIYRTLRVDGRPMVEWALVGFMGDPECAIGVLRNGTWVVDTADGLVALDDEPSLVFVFPLLNTPLNTLRDQIQSSLEQKHLDFTGAQRFPFARIVMHAIEGGGYWAEKSFDWLDSASLAEIEHARVIEGLKRLEDNRGFEQKLRHAARKHRTQLERRS